MAFIENQFPTDISIGAKGGPKWRTTVTETISGWEQRLQNWSNLKGVYDVGYGVKSIADLQSLRDFFNETRGRAHGFRFKDWLDYSVTDEALVPNGSDTVQLIKTYGSGFNNYVKNIIKPVSSPAVTMKRNGGSFTTFTVDTTTGIITLQALSDETITGITQNNPGVVTTSAAHGFSNGDEIYITGVSGMTEVNNTVFTIANVTATTFEIVDTTTYSAYTSGGTAAKHVQSTDTLVWTGEFDVPVRFQSDELSIQLNTSAIGTTSVLLEEIRL
jgi:uncharacterized protein (TIGR02217 family)